MARRISERKASIKKLLNADPAICLIKTTQGLYRTHRHWFAQLCKLPWLLKEGPRIARVKEGYSLIVGDKGFYVYKIEPGPVGPHFPTFSQQVDEAWKYKVKSRSLSPIEREHETARAYALFCIMEP